MLRLNPIEKEIKDIMLMKLRILAIDQGDDHVNRVEAKNSVEIF